MLYNVQCMVLVIRFSVQLLIKIFITSKEKFSIDTQTDRPAPEGKELPVAVTATSHVSFVQNVASGNPTQKKNNSCVSCLKLSNINNKCFYCVLPAFRPWGTIDPHSQNVQTKLYKIPKFGVNRPKSKQDTPIQKCQNLQRNVWPFGHRQTQRLDAIHFFVNFYVLFKSLYLSQN